MGSDGTKTRERDRFEMRLTDEDRKRLNRLSYRESERDLAKVVRSALIEYERSPPKRRQG